MLAQKAASSPLYGKYAMSQYKMSTFHQYFLLQKWCPSFLPVLLPHTSTFSKYISSLTSPSQSHLRKVHRYPSRQRLDSPASCATSCKTNPITQPWVCYINMAMPHVSYMLHCTSCTIPLPPKRNLPLPNWTYSCPKFPMEQWINENCL